MTGKEIIGIDIGGTNISLGKVVNNIIVDHITTEISSQESEQKILNEIIQVTEEIFSSNTAGIGIGVPSLVDVNDGIVYDVQNIPSWKRVSLKSIFEEYFKVPVYVNNDANCFAIGEKYFGKGQKYKNFVGVTIGTGIGTGIIINDQLYSGKNCGAGEFGSIKYKKYFYEYYCSSQFFKNEYKKNGLELYEKAANGDKEALIIFLEFGLHFGEFLKTILFSVDPEAIIIGGSISKSYPFFEKSMWESLNLFPYKSTINNLSIEITNEPLIAILGAVSLYYDAECSKLQNQENKKQTSILAGDLIQS